MPFAGTLVPRSALALSCIAAFAALLFSAGCGNSSSGNPNATATGPAPDISSVTPGKSPLEGGGYVMVKGLGFKSGATATVGGNAATNVVVVDRETLTLRLPGSRPGGNDLVVQNLDKGKATFAQAIDYQATTAPAPTLSKVLPNSGPSAGGTVARIEGTNFVSGGLLLVAGAPASSLTVVGASLLTAQLPGHSGSGTVDVILTNPDGQSAGLFGGYAYSDSLTAPAPQVTAIAPAGGPRAGQNHALITATNVGATGAQLFIGGVPATFALTTTGLDAVVPPGLAQGLADVAVTNADGQSSVLRGGYNYFDVSLVVTPKIGRISPPRSPPAGGGTVIVEGEGFQPDLQLLFGGRPATKVIFGSARSITCVVPPSPAGVVDVSLLNADGGAAQLHAGFTYADTHAPAPGVTSVLPGSGPTSGGTYAQLNGGNFAPGAVVIVGGRAAGPSVATGASVLTARFPPGNAGGADVTVTNPDGQSGTLGSGFSYNANVSAAAPRVNSVVPGGGPLEGGIQTLVTGDSFSPGALVFIGGRPAPAVLSGGSSLSASLPPGDATGRVDVAVTNADGQSDVLPEGFNYFIAPPVLTAASNNCGPPAGGTNVVLSGRALRPGVSATVQGQPFNGLVRIDAFTLSGQTPPGNPGGADITVLNPDGQSDTLTNGFTYIDATHSCPGTNNLLALSRVVPPAGPTTGGPVITLVGQGFAAGATVKFGSNAGTNVSLLGTGALTVTLPAGLIGPTDVTVTTPGGHSVTVTSAFEYFDPASLQPPPALVAVTPNAGPNVGGSTILLSGSGFVAGAHVYFGPTVAALDSVIDGNRMVAVSPLSLPGPVDVKVVNPDGKTGVLPFGFVFYQNGPGSPPTLQQVNPSTGSTLTTTAVVLTGSGFQAGALVFVGGVPANNVMLQGDGSLAAVFVAQAAGTVDVVVTNPDGQSSTRHQAFTYRAPAPSLSAITPAFGPVEGGTTVVITGGGLLASDTVLFGAAPAATRFLDPTAFFAAVPQGSAGFVDIVVQRGGAQVAKLAAAFEYRAGYHPGPPPSIVSLQPNTGPTSGNTVLWLTGAGLQPGATIYFGSTIAKKVMRADASHAVVIAPTGAAGSADVTVFNPDGQSSALLRGFNYVDDALLQGFGPTLLGATPAQGPESTNTVDVLTGRNFASGPLVFVGAALGSGVKLLSSSIISVNFGPQPAATVDLAVTNPDGRSSILPQSFTFLARPTLVDVANSSGTNRGPTAGGTAVTISGTGLIPGATLTFNRVPATSVSVKPGGQVITAVTPPGTAGLADVQVVNPDGQSALLTGGFLYVAPPAAARILPPTGPTRGGTVALLTGSGFTQQSAVTVGGNQALVQFGDPGTLVITTPAGAAGNADVVVTNADGQSSTLAGAFKFSAGPFGTPPAVTQIQPGSGPDTGGTYATIVGSAFNQAALAFVGAEPLGHTTVLSPTQLTGATGPGQPGKVMVAVTNPDGQSGVLANGFTYVDHALLGAGPLISGITPASALASGGYPVAIAGNNFSPTAAVYLGGWPAALNGTGTGTLLNARTPQAPAGHGDVVVTNTDGQSFTLPNAFTFLVPPPQFAGSNAVTPTYGPSSGGTVVTITGSYFLVPVAVQFGNQLGQVTAASGGSITVNTPSNIAGTVDVKVINADGQSNALTGAFTYRPPPVLLSVSPTFGGPAGGDRIHLNGRYFLNDPSLPCGPLKVAFGSANAPIDPTQPAPNATDIVIDTPSSATAGGGGQAVAVTITNSDCQATTVNGAFIYLPPPTPPTLTGVTPAAAPISGNLQITVLGAHFQPGAKVYMGNDSSAPECKNELVISDTALTCVVPAAASPGTVNITLQNPGNGNTTATLTGQFTYVAGPPPAALAILYLAPGNGSKVGGTVVLITGQGIQAGATAALSPIGAGVTVPLNNIQVVGPTAMTAVMPPEPNAALNDTWDLAITNPGGTPVYLRNGWTYSDKARHYVPQGLRMPMESNNYKGTRSLSGLNSPAWTNVIGDFTQSTPGVSDVFIGGWGYRAPRLYQANPNAETQEPGVAVTFQDVTQADLLNPDGTPVRDTCCGTTNWQNRQYYTWKPQAFTLPTFSSFPNLAFWNDAIDYFTIFWNQGGKLMASEYGGIGHATDWAGGGRDPIGNLIDFNLDGFADFVFGIDGYEVVLLSCGDARASPYCGYANFEVLRNAVSQGQQNFAITRLNIAGNISGGIIPGTTQLIVGFGPNQEVVVPSAVSYSGPTDTTTITATFRSAHPVSDPVSTFINTKLRTVAGNNITGAGDYTVALDDFSGIGLSRYTYALVDPGTQYQEQVVLDGDTSTNTMDPTNKRIQIHFTKAHPAASTGAGSVITTSNPQWFVADGSRFAFPNYQYDHTYSIAVGDVDNDGDVDVITGNDNSTGGVRSWINDAAQKKNAQGDAWNFSFTDGTSGTFGGNINGNVHALALFPSNPKAGTGLDLLVGFDTSPGSNGQGSQELLLINDGHGHLQSSTSIATPPCNSGLTQRLPTSQDAIIRYQILNIGSGNVKKGPDILAWIEVTGRTNTFQYPFRLWLNDGTGCFLGDPSGGPILAYFNGQPMSWLMGIGDLNKDGALDMIASPLSNYQTREYINYNGALADKTVFNLPAGSPGGAFSTNWPAYTTGGLLIDVNNDGFPDLIATQWSSVDDLGAGNFYAHNPHDAALKLFLNDRHGAFPVDYSLSNLPTHTQGVGNTAKTVSDIQVISPSIDSAKVGAIDRTTGVRYPGPDLLIGTDTIYDTAQIPYPTNSIYYNNRGSVRLLLNQPDGAGNPTGVFQDATYPRLPPGATFANFNVVKFADLDNDGYPDIVLGQGDSQMIRIWQNSGNGYFQDVTATAVVPNPLPWNGCTGYNAVRDLQIRNFDKDSQRLKDILVVGACSLRILINHSDVVNHKIVMVDETEAAAHNGFAPPRIPSPPGGQQAAIGDFHTCLNTAEDPYVGTLNGSLDIFLLQPGGQERVFINGTQCTDAAHCSYGYFTELTSSYLPVNEAAGCPGTDCGGQQLYYGMVGGSVQAFNYTSSNTDLLISRFSEDGYVRPYRILTNSCGGHFVEQMATATPPFGPSNDKTFGIGVADIFGHGDGTKDMMIFNIYGPRIYKNSP